MAHGQDTQKKNIPKMFNLISNGRNAHKTMRYKVQPLDWQMLKTNNTTYSELVQVV